MIITERHVKCRERKVDDPLAKVESILGGGVGPSKKDPIDPDIVEFVEGEAKKKRPEEVGPSTPQEATHKASVVEGVAKAADSFKSDVGPSTVQEASAKEKAGPRVDVPSFPFFAWVSDGISQLEQAVPSALETMKAAIVSIKDAFFGWVYKNDISDVKDFLHGEDNVTPENAEVVSDLKIKKLDSFYRHDIKRDLVDEKDLNNIENILKAAQGDEFKPYQKSTETKPSDKDGPSQETKVMP